MMILQIKSKEKLNMGYVHYYTFHNIILLTYFLQAISSSKILGLPD